MTNKNTPSQLTSDQVAQFYHVWFGLLQQTNERYMLAPSMLGKDFHQGVDVDDAGKIAKYIWSHPQVFDEFLEKFDANERELEIVRSWKQHRVGGKFYVVKHIKEGSVFLSTEKNEKSYLVKGLVSAFSDMWPKQDLPAIVDTVLLPFEGAIISCGLFYGSRVFFGASIRREIREACQQAELTYGLIRSLPYAHTVSKKEKDVAQIKFYLQSAKNAEFYKEELDDLIEKDPKEYLSLYFYHRGVLEAKTLKRGYRKLGLKGFFFAVYGSIVIAAHTDEKQVKKTVEKLVPSQDMDRILYDRV